MCRCGPRHKNAQIACCCKPCPSYTLSCTSCLITCWPRSEDPWGVPQTLCCLICIPFIPIIAVAMVVAFILALILDLIISFFWIITCGCFGQCCHKKWYWRPMMSFGRISVPVGDWEELSCNCKCTDSDSCCAQIRQGTV